MKKIFILLASMFLLNGCVESMALLSGATNGKLVQSSVQQGLSYGIKKQTGKTPLQHALAYSEEKNPEKKKERCVSFIKATNSEACMIVNQKISYSQTVVKKNTKFVLKKTKDVLEKTVEAKKLPRGFIPELRARIKEFDTRWLDRIKKENINLN